MTGWKKRKIAEAQSVATSDTSPEHVDEIQKQRHEQKPAGVVSVEHFRGQKSMENVDFQLMADLPPGTHLLYTSPPQRKPLTPEDINLLINGRGEEGDDDYVEPTGDGFGITDEDLVRLIRRVESKHNIKE